MAASASEVHGPDSMMAAGKKAPPARFLSILRHTVAAVHISFLDDPKTTIPEWPSSPLWSELPWIRQPGRTAVEAAGLETVQRVMPRPSRRKPRQSRPDVVNIHTILSIIHESTIRL